MPSQKFRDEVRRSAPPTLPNAAVNEAIDYYEDMGWNTNTYKNGCIQLAGRIAALIQVKERAADEVQIRHLPPTPGARVLSDLLTQKVTPEVKQVRDALSQICHLPFASYTEAVAWLESWCTPAPSSESVEQQGRILDEIVETTASQRAIWEDLTGGTVEISVRFTTLFYARPVPGWQEGDELETRIAIAHYDDHTQKAMAEGRIPIPKNSPLVSLYHVSQQIANATGFSQASVVAYILADLKPLLARARLYIEPLFGRPFLSGSKATIELLASDMTHDNWQLLFRMIRRLWRLDTKRELNDSDQQLLDMIEQLGRPPKTKRIPKAFWKQVCERWNAAEAQKPKPHCHQDWRATRNRFQRLKDKIENDFKLDLQL